MKTTDEILASWETEGQFTDWYAIDGYNPMDGVIRRLFVGTEDEAAKMMREVYAVPKDLAMQSFHRCSLVSGADALAYFRGDAYELPDERGVYSATEAAAILGVSRMRVNQLLNDGKLEGRKVGNAWWVYRCSVENRLGRM